MLDEFRWLLTLLSALGCGVMAGFFGAFSCCVMQSLGRIPPVQGLAAMQAINVVVLNPWFLAVFLGTGMACALEVVTAVLRWHTPGTVLVLGGSLLYLLGTLGVTMVCNVPMNNALEALTPADSQSVPYWTHYLATWTAWNHVRTVAALLAAVCLTLALCRGIAT